MIRVLHVCDAGADFQTGRGVAQLASGLGQGFESSVRTIGRGGDFLNVASAVVGLRRLAGQWDVVHAWGVGALSAVAFGGFGRVVFTPDEFPTRRQVAWVRAVMGYRDVNVICPTTTMRRAMVGRGVPLSRCHLIRPGVDFARLKGRRRDTALREALGLAPDHLVILTAGESTREANHWQAVWAGTILNVLDRRTRMLMWGRGRAADVSARLGERMGQPELVCVAESRLGRRVEYEELLGAADLIVVSATGPVSTLPIAVGMAGGVPIVAGVTATVAELLEDRHTALMTQTGVPRLLALRMKQMREDASLQWSLADMARTEAYEYFSLTRFLEQHRGAYRQAAAGEAVEIVEAAPGAGARFHGRG